MKRALVLAVTIAGCYQRGSSHHDAGAAAVAAAPDAGAAVHGDPAGAADPSATITIALETEPPTLDPLVGADAITQRIAMGDVVEGLVAPGAHLADPPVAALADRWAAADGDRTWTFHLRDAKFHDGRPVTGDDVVASVHAAEQTWLAIELPDLASVAAKGPDVTFTYTRAHPDALGDLVHVPIEPGGRTDARAPIGTGPLRVVGWSDGAIELARWDGYWGTPAGAAHVVYRVAADRTQALRMLAGGDVDVVVQVPADEAGELVSQHPGFATFAYRLPAYLAAIYDARRPALATADARRALTALLDRASIARDVLHAHEITGPFPESDPGYDASITPVPFDRALAGRLLQGAHPSLEILVPAGSTTMARIADIWASDARGVVDLHVTQLDFGAMLSRLAAGDFDIALTSMSTGPELDLASRLASTAPRDTAWTGLQDAETDRLLAAIAAEPDDARRAELRRALHRRIADQQPMAFLAPDVRLGIARAAIGGVDGAPEGGPPHAARLWKAR